MNRYLCIHCWRILQPGELLYRCLECEAPRAGELEPWMRNPNAETRPEKTFRPVAKGNTHSILRYFTSDAEDERADGPVCPDHPGVKVHLFCTCQAPLLPRAHFTRGEPLGLGIAGSRSAGKTMLLMAMIRQLHRHGFDDRSLSLLGIGDTDARFGELASRLFRDGEKPVATSEHVPEGHFEEHQSAALDAVPQSFCWQLNDSEERHRPPRLLAVYDLAGETWGRASIERLNRFDRYLHLLSSLVFVVDGAAVARDLGHPVDDAWDLHSDERRDDGATDRQWLARVIDRMGEHTQEVDLALVLTKADLLWHSSDWSRLAPAANPPAESDGADEASQGASPSVEDVLGSLLRRSHRRDLLHAGQHHFREVKLFATSSLGFRPAPEDVVDHRLERTIDPVGVLEPLEWLLQANLPKRRRR